MSDEFLEHDKNDADDAHDELDVEYEEIDEEISTDEVDRVLETVLTLMETVQSETIQEYLEETYNHVFSLIYEEEGGDDLEDHSEAA